MRSNLSWRLSWLVVVLLAVQSAAGLFFAPYRDEAWALAAWLGNDLVTLLVAVPVLTLALLAARRGSRRAELVWAAMLAYSIYNAGYYLFGAVMNPLFPVYVLLFVLPVFALVAGLGRADLRGLVGEIPSASRTRPVAIYLGATGSLLTVGWLAQWALIVFGGQTPSLGEPAFRLIAAMDLSFMVPWFGAGAVLLWRRTAAGVLLGAVMALKGGTYTLVLTAGSIAGALRGVDGAAAQLPIWAVWSTIGCGMALWLLSGVRERG